MRGVDGGEQIEIELSQGAPQQIRVWQGSGPYVILAQHGLEGHSLWFGALGPALARRGITLLAVDRAGSGRDARPRGDCSRPDVWLDELEALCGHVAPSRSLFVLAHSWGAKRLILALHERALSVCGGLFVAPLLFSAEGVDPPEKWDVHEPNEMTSESAPVVPICLPDERKTKELAVLQAIAEDHARLFYVTTRFVIEDARVERRLAGLRGPMPWPTFVVYGSEDRLIDEPKTRRFFERFAPSAVTYVIVGAGHLVLLERADELAGALAQFLHDVT